MRRRLLTSWTTTGPCSGERAHRTVLPTAVITFRHDMIKALNDSAELSDEAESENMADMDAYADLDGGTTGSGDNYLV